MNNTKPEIIRKKARPGAKPDSQVTTPDRKDLPDPASFLKPLDAVEEKKTLQPLEELLRVRHKVEPENYPEMVKLVIQVMEAYIAKMSKGKGANMQVHAEQTYELHKLFMKVLRERDVVMSMDTVLWYFDTYSLDAFFAEMPFRGTHLVKFGTQEAHDFFTKMVSICQLIADIRKRTETIKTMDFQGALKGIPNIFERHRNGLATYLQAYVRF